MKFIGRNDTGAKYANLSLALLLLVIPAAFADGFAYVTNADSNNVSAIRTSDNAVVVTVPVGMGPYGVAITPDGSFAYVPNGSTANVSVIQTADNLFIATIPAGPGPCGVAITPDGTLAYVTNQTTLGTVSVIRTSDNTVIDTVAVGSFPVGIEIMPNGILAYVATSGSDKVTVIRIADNAVIAGEEFVVTQTFANPVAISNWRQA